MDVDPLADTVPPRYAIESDDEEDEFTPFSTTELRPGPLNTASITITGSVPTSDVLVVAAKEAARLWGKGAELGAHVAQVMVNDVLVGKVFKPNWSSSGAVVLLSEDTAQLPVWAMYEYAERVLDAAKPSKIVLLDAYPVPAYIDSENAPFDRAPVRMLTTVPGRKLRDVQPFQPPNLIQSTSAAFVALASLPSTGSVSATREATLLLLPSPHIPPPAPSSVIASLGSGSGSDYERRWPDALLVSIHRTMFEDIIGEKTATVRKWASAFGGETPSTPAQRRGDIGEGGMYM